MITRDEIGAVILAGGRGRRMDGIEKGLLPFRGRPLVSHAIDVVEPHVCELIVSANRRVDEYAALGATVVMDEWPNARGPLAGIASALNVTRMPYLMIVPCDTPFLPPDLVPRLAAALSDAHAEAAVAHGGGTMQPLCALMHCTLAPMLRDYIEAGGAKATRWWAERRTVAVTFDEPQAFININTPQDRAEVE